MENVTALNLFLEFVIKITLTFIGVRAALAS